VTGNAETTQLPEGSILGGCRIVRPIGKGGMGEVYLARDVMLEREVALKVLPPTKLDREHVARFLREARACSQIEHPNVITIYNVGEEDGHYFIVMKYVRGRDLAEIVKTQGGPLPWRTALKIMRLATKGVHAVHTKGLLHRDIKPSNIMVGDDSQVVLMDFGLVREETESQLTLTGAILGTPVFMAPEQCLGEELDERCDIYGVGTTLYYLLTGQLPYDGSAKSVLMQVAGGKRPQPVCVVNPFVPQDVSDLVDTAMARFARDRFSSARELDRRMQRLLKQPDRPAPKVTDTTKITAENTADFNREGDLDLVPELEPVRNIATQTGGEVVRKVVLWAVGFGALLLLLTVGLVLNSLFGNRGGGGHTDDDTAPPVVSNGEQDSQQKTVPDGVDSQTMVRIPAGFVRLGNDVDKLRDHLDKLPVPPGYSVDRWERLKKSVVSDWPEKQRRLYVEEFWIDKYEVTNAEYAEFVKATGHAPPQHWNNQPTPPLDIKDHPVTHVSYDDAQAYARWAGKKLPTVAQWVRAFRSDSDQYYPWGNTWEPKRANVRENTNFSQTSKTTPVTATPDDKSSFGVFNLVGNVTEIVRDKTTDDEGTWYIRKGGKWSYPGCVYGIGSAQYLFSTTSKIPLERLQEVSVGFRCVVEVAKRE